MIKKLLCLCLFILILIVPVNALIDITIFGNNPPPAEYTTTQYVKSGFNISGNESCYYNNRNNIKWYWVDYGIVGNRPIIDTIPACDGLTQCIAYPNATIYTTANGIDLFVTIPGYDGFSTCWDNSATMPIGMQWNTYNAPSPNGYGTYELSGNTNYGGSHYKFASYVVAPLQDANFTCSPTTGELPLTVGCAANSTLETNYTWSWGDGNKSTYTGNYGGSHLYPSYGKYTVRLDIYSNENGWRNYTRVDYIDVTQPDYYCTASPAYIPNTQDYYVYGEIHADNVTKVNSIIWTFKKHQNEGGYEPVNQFLEINSSSKTLNYYKTGSNFYGYDILNNSYNILKGLTLPNPVSLNPVGQSDIIHVNCLAKLDDGLTTIDNSMDVLIGGTNVSGFRQIKVFNVDGNSGANIAPSTISIQTINANKWSNVSTQTGSYNFSYSQNELINLYGDASGYTRGSKTGYIVNNEEFIYLNLFATNTSSAGFTNLYVKLETTSNNGNIIPVSNMMVRVVNSLNTTEEYYASTNNVGTASFLVLPDTSYTISTPDTSLYYQSSIQIFTGTANPIHKTIMMILKSVIPTQTQPTPTQTPTVKPTYIGGGDKNTTAAVCGVESENIVQDFKNKIACWGIDDRSTQDLALAAIIILVCAYFVGRYAKGLGATIGATIGFVLSIAAGLIDVWILFAFVIIAGLIFGLKLYNAGKD